MKDWFLCIKDIALYIPILFYLLIRGLKTKSWLLTIELKSKNIDDVS